MFCAVLENRFWGNCLGGEEAPGACPCQLSLIRRTVVVFGGCRRGLGALSILHPGGCS